MADYTLIQSGDPDAAENVGSLAGDIDRGGIVSGLVLSNYDAGAPSIDVAAGKTVHILDTATAEWTLDDSTQKSEQRDKVQVVAHVDAQTVSLAAGAVNELYVDPNWDTTDSPVITASTTGAPTPEAEKIGEVDTSADEVSERWGVIEEDGTLSYPDNAAANAALSSLPDGVVVIDRTNGVRMSNGAISVPTLEAADGTFSSSITDPSNKTITTELATISDTAREQAVDNTDNILSLLESLSETRFDLGLTKLNYEDGLFDTFLDGSKIDSFGSPSPFTNYGVDGYLYIIQGYNLSSASLSTTANLTDGSVAVRGVDFNGDGTELVVAGFNSGVDTFTLSTPYDVTTATFDSNTELSGTNVGEGGQFNDDGTKYYRVIGDGRIDQFALSTPYDVSTYSADGELSTNLNNPKTMSFADSGVKLYVPDNSNGGVYRYDLSTSYDVTTASYTDYADWPTLSGAKSIVVKDDGSKLIAGNIDVVKEYRFNTPYVISSLTETASKTVTSNSEAMCWHDGGAKFLLGSGGEEVKTFTGAFENATGSSFTESKSLGFIPSTVVISDERSGDLSVSYEIQDSNGNTVTVTDSEVGTEVDVSTLANGDVTITVTLDSPDPSKDDQLDSFGTYFN